VPRLDPKDPRLDELIKEYRRYDQSVDIVSIFEWLYTKTKSLPETVKHFERFPRITVDNVTCTPDFTVLFHNHPVAIVGEIAQFATKEQSVDSLCAQLLKYDGLTEIPGQNDNEKIESIDTILIVPIRLGSNAVHRVLRERLESPEHIYKPQRRPCIVQHSFDEGKYVLQRLGDPENGILRDPTHGEGIGKWFKRGNVNVDPMKFSSIKASRVFVNDTVNPLYLATHLWTRTIPSKVGGSPKNKPIPVGINPSQIANEIREQYGSVRSSDVKRALDLLEKANLAEKTDLGEWRIAWSNLGTRSKEKDVVQILAKRSLTSPDSGPLAQLKKIERNASGDKGPIQRELTIFKK